MNRVGQESSIEIAACFITRLHDVIWNKLSLNFIDQNRLSCLGMLLVYIGHQFLLLILTNLKQNPIQDSYFTMQFIGFKYWIGLILQ